MKIALIQPSNILHAPYIKYYTSILDERQIPYDIINWSKINLCGEKEGDYAYNYLCPYSANKFKKLLGYYMFAKYAKKIVREQRYDKLIILVPELALFLGDLLIEYKERYILDIRDYGSVKLYPKKLKHMIENASFTAISSEGYKAWLPKAFSYVTCHNTSLEHLKRDREDREINLQGKSSLVISNIGVIRYYEDNCKLIDIIKDEANIKLNYIGTGVCEEDLKKYCQERDIMNVHFWGRYKKEDELDFYRQSDWISLIMSSSNRGCQTAMPNRFYNACLTQTPLIANKYSYMGSLVEKYNLGIAIEIDKADIVESLLDYGNAFDSERFKRNCNDFLNKVKEEQMIFYERVIEFAK